MSNLRFIPMKYGADGLRYLLRSVLVAQSGSNPEVVGSIPAEVKCFFLCLVPSSISLLGLTLSGKSIGSL